MGGSPAQQAQEERGDQRSANQYRLPGQKS